MADEQIIYKNTTTQADVPEKLVNLGDDSYGRVTLPSIRYVDVTLTTDTSAYAANDVLADRQVVTGAVRQADALGIFFSAELLDRANQTEFDFDLMLLKADVAVGAENDVVAITDDNAGNILCVVRYRVASNPSIPLVASKFYNIGPNHPDLPKPVIPATGTANVYVALVLRSGTPTFAADSLRLRLWFKDAV